MAESPADSDAGELPPGARLLGEHPALIVTAVYLVASSIGMFFAWDYLRRFGINVFLYAEIGDFLLASLKEPLTWALVLLSVALVLADNWSSRRFGRKPRSRWLRWYGSRGYRKVNHLVTVLLVVTFLDIFATYKAGRTFEGYGDIVEVRLAGEQRRRSAILLGTTTRFVFLLDATTRKVYVHPNESLAVITFPAPDRR